MRRKLFGSTIALILLVALAQPATAAIQKVRDTTAREYGFAIDRNLGGDVVRAWQQDSAAHPYRFQIWYQATGDPAQRLTGPNTGGDIGGLDLDNSRGALLSYDIFKPQSGDYDVRLYDIVADQPFPVPAGVNTAAWDSHPTVSGDYLLFQRGDRFGPNRVILFNMQTTTQIVLATAPAKGIVFADQVNGDYAVYTVCPGNNRCIVRRYQISTPTTSPPLPNAGRAAYSPTVDDDGNVYYVIGHPTRCGVNTQIHRWTGVTPAPKIEQLPNGIDIPTTWAYKPPSTPIVVYFTRLVCQPSGNFRSGIYRTDG